MIPQTTVRAPAYPGLKQDLAEAEEPVFDVRISRLMNGRLKVQILSDEAFRLFLPQLKNRVPGRQWNDAAKCWLVPANSALQLRELIEERTIRLGGGLRSPLSFNVTATAKQAMCIEDFGEHKVTEVKIGQIWEDNDPRFSRKLEIVDVQPLSNYAYVRNTASGRRTKISLARFVPNKTGYSLVKDISD